MASIRIRFYILAMLLISGCTAFHPSIAPSITPSPRQLLPNYTITSIQYSTPTITITHISTPIQSDSSVTPVSTSSNTSLPPTLTQILTPVPTLNNLQAKKYFSELLKNNAGCKLPCWWGITPGASTWEEVHRLIDYTGFGQSTESLPNGAIFHGAGYDWHAPLITNSFGYYEVGGIIEGIDIFTDGYYDKNQFRTLWNSYSPNNILATYGLPTEVYISASQGVGGAASGIIFKYTDEFMLIYGSKPLVMEIDGIPIFRICPSWQDITWEPELHIFIKSADLSLSFKDFIHLISSFPLEQYIPIKEAANIDVDEFNQRFIPGYGPACVDTPQDIWK